MGHEKSATYAGEAQVLIVEHAQPQVHLGANGIEAGVKRFFSDGELGQAHRHNALDSPDEQRQWRFRRNDLDDTRRLQHFIGNHQHRLRIQKHLQRGEGGMNSKLRCRESGTFKLVGGVNLNVKRDGFLGRAFEAQRLAPVSIAADGLGGEGAGQGVRVVLKNDHAGQRVEWIKPDDGTLLHWWRTGKTGHMFYSVSAIRYSSRVPDIFN